VAPQGIAGIARANRGVAPNTRSDILPNLKDIAIKTAMQYSEMDTIVRDLIDKNYASLGDHLDLYRFWVVLLHVKGVRFEPARD